MRIKVHSEVNFTIISQEFFVTRNLFEPTIKPVHNDHPWDQISWPLLTGGHFTAVIPKICSVDHWWSARLAEVVRESLIKTIFCASRTTKLS